MPSIAEATVLPMSNKKRRREDPSGGLELQMKMSSSQQPRRPYEAFPPHYDPGTGDELYHRHIISPKRRIHDHKRQRIGHLECGGCDVYFAFEPRTDTTERYDDTTAQKQAPRPNGRVDLSPCHICRRKPTVKSELDAFGDCECCGERTCYICTRKCEGPGVVWRASLKANQNQDENCMVVEVACRDGDESIGSGTSDRTEDESTLGKHVGHGGRPQHRDQICSACCLERGADGVIWCLGCLKAEEAA
ncbi:hypothetical protein DL98DRAFT_648979 [Cadophora sp. DSE1049]|nr:hypothetical protein DL98DRAFT_648979 [Cadophora sp. DSE1049]